MDKTRAQAQKTRKSNQQKRIEDLKQKIREAAELRATLKAIANDETATPGERLEAVKLIMELERK